MRSLSLFFVSIVLARSMISRLQRSSLKTKLVDAPALSRVGGIAELGLDAPAAYRAEPGVHIVDLEDDVGFVGRWRLEGMQPQFIHEFLGQRHGEGALGVAGGGYLAIEARGLAGQLARFDFGDGFAAVELGSHQVAHVVTDAGRALLFPDDPYDGDRGLIAEFVEIGVGWFDLAVGEDSEEGVDLAPFAPISLEHRGPPLFERRSP